MEASWAEVGTKTQKIFLKKMAWMNLMKEMKGWNPKNKFKFLEERETGSHTSHREILAHERAQSDSGTPRYRRRSLIFPTTIQKFQALKAKGNFIPGSQTIPVSFKKKTRSPRKKKNFFQTEEERSRHFDEETDGLSQRDPQNQKKLYLKILLTAQSKFILN
ncbi:hypothetical protein O181_049724 [Austropuccinia psidii MF-1]|uniref:Uncharacterized protein n=1 Tax=Austropuccinia psidii MF-1 TaxID=1389203 RepID=A0A9Q3HP12_9BASI|nr:hypothetical protein [Austropuccinia psidii MF-1]